MNICCLNFEIREAFPTLPGKQTTMNPRCRVYELLVAVKVIVNYKYIIGQQKLNSM